MKVYFFNAWNILDWVNLSIFFVVISQRYTWYIEGLQKTTVSVDTFTDIHGVAFLAKMEVNIMSLNAFCIYFKVLKYLDMVPGMDQLFLTLGSCATELLIFFIMFFIVYIGFGVAFNLAFGLLVPEYRTIQVSMLSLLRIIVGDFDFDALLEANRPMAFILFLGYVVLVFFILMNMFLAIIGDAYAEVKSKQATNKMVLPSLVDKFRALYHLFKRNRVAAKEIRFELDEALFDDGVVDRAELKAILDHHAADIERLGLSTNVAVMMRRYDTDGDGSLSRSELDKLVSEINAGITKGLLTEGVLSDALGAGAHLTESNPSTMHGSTHDSAEASNGVSRVTSAKVAEQKLRRQPSANLRRMNVYSISEDEKRLEALRRMVSEKEQEEALLAAEAAKKAYRRPARSAFELYREAAATSIERLCRGYIVRKEMRRDVAAFVAKYRDRQRFTIIGRQYLRRMGEAVHHFRPIGWHKGAFTDEALHGAPKCVVRSATRVQAHWRGFKTRKDLREGLFHF